MSDPAAAEAPPEIVARQIHIVPAEPGKHARGRPPIDYHPDNARKGDVGALMEAIRAHGMTSAINVQASTGYVISGNHRLQACRQLGMPKVPVVWIDVDDDEALRQALNDNYVSDLAEYHQDRFDAVMLKLADTPQGWAGTGYGDAEITDLLGDVAGVALDPGQTRRRTVEIDETYDTVRYFGGKSARRATCRFVLSLMPLASPDDMYIEPSGAFYGVGLHRQPPRGNELLNDLNGRIVNWWLTLRGYPTELTYLIAHTPSARLEFDHQLAWLQEHHPIDRPLDDLSPDEQLRSALALTVVLADSITASDGDPVWSGHPASLPIPPMAKRIGPLAERMAKVRLEHKPAIDLLERWQAEPNAVIYFDPPYRQGAETYATGPLPDRDAHAELLLAQTGRVLVSGYAGDWPALDAAGWHRHELNVVSPIVAAMTAADGADPVRTECVWTNYDPPEDAELDKA